MDNLGTLKRDSIAIAGLYALSERDDFQRYAERILNCAEHFDFVVEPLELDYSEKLLTHIENVWWCRCRQCPLCQWARIAKCRAKFFPGLGRLQCDYPELKWAFFTFTLKNCPIDELRQHIKLMSKGWHRLMALNLSIHGYVRSLEVTRSEFGEAHPHYHVLFCSHESFSRSIEDWSRLWGQALDVEYGPVVYGRRVYQLHGQGLLSALLEVVKYSVKPSDLVSDAEWLYELSDQMRRLRALTVGGLVSQYVSQKQLDKIASEMKSGDEQFQVGVPGSLHWDCRSEKYTLCWR